MDTTIWFEKTIAPGQIDLVQGPLISRPWRPARLAVSKDIADSFRILGFQAIDTNGRTAPFDLRNLFGAKGAAAKMYDGSLDDHFIDELPVDSQIRVEVHNTSGEPQIFRATMQAMEVDESRTPPWTPDISNRAATATVDVSDNIETTARLAIESVSIAVSAVLHLGQLIVLRWASRLADKISSKQGA